MDIAEYVAFMAGGGRGPRGDELRRRAREHLLASGWTLYKFAKCDGRQELRYRAPHGASYISLIVACKKFQLFTTAPPRTPAAARGKPRRKRSASPGCSSGKGMGKEIARVIGPIGAENGGCKRGFGDGEEDGCGPAVGNPFAGECRARHRKVRRVSALYADDALQKYAAKKRKKASASASPAASPQSSASPAASPSRVLRPRPKDGDKAEAAAACRPTRARTILAVLMDKKIFPPTAKLSYKRSRDEPPAKQGTVTAQGTIRCACGCGGKAFTVAEFAAHAGGGCGDDRPSASVYLNDGRSLSQCLVQLMRAHGGGSSRAMGSPSPRARLKRRCPPELGDGDWVCSVCADFGDMLICDCCPSTFHHGCVGLDATPHGEWFCPSCRCAVCGSSEFELDDGQFTDKTVIYCDQCEREYHAGCVRGRGDQLECCPEGPWLCGHDCSNIFQRLQGLVGRSMPTSAEGVTFTVLRSTKLPEEEAMAAEEHGKLCAAFDVLHECFITLIEPQTRTDLSHDIVFNRESELRRLDFRGFYVVGLEKGGELITVGTLRYPGWVYGRKVAELPLVGTRFVHRRQGMCRLLIINQLEKLLGELGVERLVLPAVPELLPTWTGSFGFQAMSHSDRMEIAEHTIMCFQGTTMCHKFIVSAATP
ncbi:increased DNA methylation 1-like [Triticum dicoccoides]|uniref:increased DNA methylation 1-like n=1 Tax=Triticum dicoccoides TaxID=85692 RepID=UPI001890212F|nr:increased DNA methylation 1-like [Triticum dicoccoides]